MDQPKYTIERHDHEYMDSKTVRLISRVCTFCEEKGHAIMDCLFMHFHIRACIPRDVELQNVARALMDQTQAQEPRTLIV